MKKHLHKIFWLAVLAVPLTAFALAGHLASPSLAFPAEFSATSRSNILAALTHPDYKFTGGEFINSSTDLYYAGDTKALNLFLLRLSKCADTVLCIAFVPKIEMEPTATWQVAHTAWGDPNRLDVRINLNAKEIHLEELAIPGIKGGADRPAAK